MSERRLIFMDDARLVPDLAGSADVLIISLDSQAASELGSPGTARVKSILEYAETPAESYDELYAQHQDALRERLRPKDPEQQSRFLFDALWDDILLNHVGISYLETLVRAIYVQERPTRVEFAVADRQLLHVIREIGEEINKAG